MSIVICGAGGQLGRELVRLADARTTALDRAGLDITDAAAVQATLQRLQPRAVINAAAYTAVDRAESDSATACSINRDGAANLAQACADVGAALLHVSTDYVFDGTQDAPYAETDPANPQSVYGRSKWEGEQAVRKACQRHLILRVSWLFGAHGGNFVKTMLRLARERPELRVVADQRGGPTPAADFALALTQLARRIAAGEELPWGTYHYAGQPAVSWHGFASVIVDAAQAEGLIAHKPAVQAISTADYPTPARRPANSTFDTRRCEARLGLRMPLWQTGLVEMLQTLKTP